MHRNINSCLCNSWLILSGYFSKPSVCTCWLRVIFSKSLRLLSFFIADVLRCGIHVNVCTFTSLPLFSIQNLPNTPYVLEELVNNVSEEASSTVKLQLLTAVMKMFMKRPPECQDMLGRLLEHAIG